MLKIKATHYRIYVSSHTPCSRINYVDLHLEVPLGKGLLATYPILSELKNILQHDHAIFISIYIATARMVAHSFQKKNGRPFLMCFIRLFNYQHRRFQRLCPKNLMDVSLRPINWFSMVITHHDTNYGLFLFLFLGQPNSLLYAILKLRLFWTNRNLQGTMQLLLLYVNYYCSQPTQYQVAYTN